MVVLLVAVPMGMAFDLLHEHSYTLQGHEYQLGEQYLVEMPDRVFGMFDDITTPDFPALAQLKAWKWVFMFFIIGSLESLLSAKAVDLLDPWKRKTNMDRDMVAVGMRQLVRVAGRRTADDLGNRAVQSQHRQRSPHTIRRSCGTAYSCCCAWR